MFKLLRSIFFVSICAYGAYNVLHAEDDQFFYKPFNYRAFEARKRGYKIIVPQIAETISSLEYLKTVPTWPGYIRFPNPDNQSVIHAQAGLEWASFGFDNRSDLKSISTLVLGTENPTLADISLIARLHQYSLNAWLSAGRPTYPAVSGTSTQGEITIAQTQAGHTKPLWSYIGRNAGNTTSADPEGTEYGTTAGSILAINFQAYKRYLAFLAEKELLFKAEMQQPYLTLNYQAALLQHMLTIGIEVPIIYKIQKMEMIQEFSSTENQILDGGATSNNAPGAAGTTIPGASWQKINAQLQDSFPSAYPLGLKNFYNDLLAQKDLSSDPRATKFGIGDISFVLNRRIENDYWTLGLIGVAITTPSAGAASKKFVWPIELGNGGFWAARMHGSLFWKHSNLVNPHVLGELRFCFPSAVEHRVSQLISYDASSGKATVDANKLPLGKNLLYEYKSFTGEPESTIPALAAGPTRSVELRRGATFLTRLGNVFDQAFFSEGALDIYYQFTYKFADSLTLKTENGLYDLASLTKNTESWAQTLGLAYTYHWNDTICFEIKGTTVFSGHNVLRQSSISLATQMRF